MKHSNTKKQLVKKIQNFFLLNKIRVLPMKLYSDDNDMDIVVIDKKQYRKAVNLLKGKNWQKNNNLSKIRERDKDFFSHQKQSCLIHLHQAFSWNTVTYLDGETLWKRKINKNKLLYPSPEDELLIIAAHSLFENKRIVPEEMVYGQALLKKDLDFSYMSNHARKFNWRKGLKLILFKIDKNQSFLSPKELLEATLSKLLKDLVKLNLRLTAKEILNYFCVDWIWSYRNALKKKK